MSEARSSYLGQLVALASTLEDSDGGVADQDLRALTTNTTTSRKASVSSSLPSLRTSRALSGLARVNHSLEGCAMALCRCIVVPFVAFSRPIQPKPNSTGASSVVQSRQNPTPKGLDLHRLWIGNISVIYVKGPASMSQGTSEQFPQHRTPASQKVASAVPVRLLAVRSLYSLISSCGIFVLLFFVVGLLGIVGVEIVGRSLLCQAAHHSSQRVAASPSPGSLPTEPGTGCYASASYIAELIVLILLLGLSLYHLWCCSWKDPGVIRGPAMDEMAVLQGDHGAMSLLRQRSTRFAAGQLSSPKRCWRIINQRVETPEMLASKSESQGGSQGISRVEEGEMEARSGGVHGGGAAENSRLAVDNDVDDDGGDDEDGNEPGSVGRGSRYLINCRSGPCDPVEGGTVRMYRKYCRTCQWWQPPRASHCGVCNVCVDESDHHCVMIGACVGKRNRSHFILFLWFTTLAANFVFAVSIRHIYLVSDKQLTHGSSICALLVIVISILSVIQLNAGSLLYVYLYGWLGVTLREYRKKGSLYEGYDYATKWSRHKNKNTKRPFQGGRAERSRNAAGDDAAEEADEPKGWSLDIESDEEDDVAVNPEGKLVPTPWSSGSFFRNLFELFFRHEGVGVVSRRASDGESGGAGDGDGWCFQI
jgi:hypothetical protein